MPGLSEYENQYSSGGYFDTSDWDDTMSKGNVISSNPLSKVIGLSGFVDKENAIEEQNKRMAFSEYMMDKGNAFNEYMYDKNNEYNLPINQVQRLINAGLNPAAAVQSVAGIQNASAPSSASAPAAPELNPELAMVEANLEKIKAETEKTKTETSEIPRVNDAVINQAKANAEKLRSEGKVKDEELKQMQELFESVKGLKEQELENLKKQYLILVEGVETAKAQKNSAIYESLINKFRAEAASDGVDMQSNIWNNALRFISGYKDAVVEGLSILLNGMSVEDAERAEEERFIEKGKRKIELEKERELKNKEYDKILDEFNRLRSIVRDKNIHLNDDEEKQIRSRMRELSDKLYHFYD